MSSQRKQTAIDDFARHVSAGKVEFYKKFGMDFVLGHREGPWLYDLDGKKRLFNCHTNGGTFNLGHRHHDLVQVLREALDDMDIGNHHLISPERSKLARQLADSFPGDLNICVFAVGGGEAVDLALKVALGHTGRSRIISAQGGYHGHTGLALTVGDPHYREPFGVDAGKMTQVPYNDLSALESAMNGDVAAVILESIPATLGMPQPKPGYLEAVRALCDKQGALLILDEVQSGLGRTGQVWSFESAGIVPDMVIIGKGLSGGIYPIAATMLRENLDHIFRTDPFIHISTFGGAELGCRVAQKVMEITTDPDFLEHVKVRARQFRDGLDHLQHKYPKFFKGVRQSGLMIGLELRDTTAGPILSKAAFDHDLLMIYANNDKSIAQLLPPLTITESEVSWVLGQLDQAMNSARKMHTAYQVTSKAGSFLKKLTGRS